MHEEPRAEWEAIKSREADRIEAELDHPVVEFRQPSESEVERLEGHVGIRSPDPRRD